METDSTGEVVAYNFSKHHPLSYSGTDMEWVRVPAYGEKTGRRNVIHIMARERIDQRRGVPFLAPVIEALKQLGRYTDAELVAAVVSGMFTVFIEKESPEDGPPIGSSIPEEMQVDAEDETTIRTAFEDLYSQLFRQPWSAGRGVENVQNVPHMVGNGFLPGNL